VTKQRRRDKESVAESHREKIIGMLSSEAPKTNAPKLLLATIVVNLARLCLVRQRRSLHWIPRCPSRLSSCLRLPALS
jgi:hypothetical protein